MFLFGLYDRRQWSLTKPRSPKYVSFKTLWSPMISYKTSVAQICVLFRLNDCQWSLTKPRSHKYVSYLDSMIVNDLLQSLGRPKMFFIWSLWSSMISYTASLAQICVLFRLNDYKWPLTKPRSPKYVSYLDSMIVNDLLQILGRPTNVFIWSLWLSMISYKALVAQICVFLDSMIVNDLLQSLGRPNTCLIWPYMVVNDLLWSLGLQNMCLI